MSINQIEEESIFDLARKIDSREARSAYLAQACRGNTALLERVKALLDVNDQQAEFMESPPSGVDETKGLPPKQERPGTEIGRYKLMEQIGEGGFGVVYVAEQTQPIRRKVALKVIKPGMDTKEVIARFEAERQALALMDHPNIAQVLDAGTTELGRPYFVMEYVRGMPITDYCDKSRLSTRDRLELFVSVCQALQHAHQKGIIHRDIKPSNVLITEHDGKPVPKVIDFGVAKAINQRLTERTIYTRHQQVVGTPLYMSPEQAELSGIDVDTRTDIYSLGVLLYELLTGNTPFDRSRFNQAAFAEICRIIREEEPPKPSTKISTLGERSATVASARKADGKRLRQLIRGDLDWIVMRAIEKDRTRRYETANGFATDIQRYLNNEVVLASPPSVTYRVSRFIGRNRGPVAVATALMAAICIGLVGTSAGFVSARHAARRLTDQLRRQTVSRLTAQSEAIRDEAPVRSLLLAMEAVDTTRREDGTVMPIAHETLLTAVQRVGGQPLAGQCNLDGPYGDALGAIAISRDSRRLAIGDGNLIRIWDLTTPEIRNPLIVLRGHSDRVQSVTFSPDTRYLVSGSRDATCRRWDLSDRDPDASVVELRGHLGRVESVVISDDGQWIATAGHETILWDATAKDPSATSQVLCQEHENKVNKLAISSDNRWLVSCGRDNDARLYDLNATDQAASECILPGHTQRVFNASFSPNSKLLATSSWDTDVRIWNLASKDPSDAPVVLSGHKGHVNAVAFSPDGRWLLTGCYDHTARLWDLESDDPNVDPRELRGHDGWIGAAGLSSDGRWAITGSNDRTARLWDLSSGDSSPSSTIVARHDGNVLGVAISEDCQWLVTAAYEDSPRVWKLQDDVAPPDSPYAVRAFGSASRQLISPNGRWLVTSAKTARLWDLREGKPASSSIELDGYESRGMDYASAAISSDSRWLVMTGENSTARLWDLTGADPTATPTVLDAHSNKVQSVAISEDGRWLGTASLDGTARIWDLSSANPAATARVLEGHQGAVQRVWIGTDGDLCVTTSEAEKIARVWDLTATNPSSNPRELSTPLRPSHMIVSKNERWLVIAEHRSDIGRLMIWDLKEEVSAAPRVIAAHDRRVTKILEIPDGGRLLTSSWDGTTRIWDLSNLDPWASSFVINGQAEAVSQDGRLLLTGNGDEKYLWDISTDLPPDPSMVLRGCAGSTGISSDNRWLFSCGGDAVRFWDLNVESLYRRARLLAGRDLSLKERDQYKVHDN